MFDPQLVKLFGDGILETLYMTLVSTAISYLLGLPIGVLLTTSAPDGISPRPVLYRTLDVVVNILRSVPFLILMVCVACFTMISGLLIIILERTQMIGLLKALGAQTKSIRYTFLWFAVFIVGQGMLWGNILGIGLVVLQQKTGFVTLDPANYYVSEAPMELNIPLIVALNAATLLVTMVVLLIPTVLISRIHPARSMRYE